MASLLQAYLGRIEAEAWSFTATQGGANTITLTAGEYYPKGYTGESNVQFIEHLEDQLAALAGTPTVTLDLDNTNSRVGKVHIDWDSTSTSVTWGSATTLRDILGFTGDLNAATSHTGTYAMRYVWLPTLAPSSYPTTINEIWEPFSNSRVRASPNGSSHGRRGYQSNRALLTYDLLPSTDVVVNPATYNAEDNATFRSFWKNVIANVMPVRVLFDRTTYAASTDYVTALVGNAGDDPIGRLLDYAKPLRNNMTLWDVRVPLVEHDDTT